MLEASTWESIKWKTPREAYELIDNMASSDNEVNERAQPPKKGGVLELQCQDTLLAQKEIMTQQLENLMKKLSQLSKEIQNVPMLNITNLCKGVSCVVVINQTDNVPYKPTLRRRLLIRVTKAVRVITTKVGNLILA